ncbi:MAG: 23S rRNA (pseudouridine(1915)-N(3))-methyltransferase RlmH [Bacteroidetes bacterium]|nr:23S rRNA (pseudouridine(1915)-N(3))-methyltransferase RlmH [Bacteroidota bacterium]HET6244022.1 23S rRNA (pseudouridine(1915)-N(3))-methyltransferase RlmH [Bacteroidia bacterium]
MNIVLIVVGKNDEQWLEQGFLIYTNRLKHYINFETLILPVIKNAKNLSIDILKKKEGEMILANLSSSDIVVLLDEHGKHYSSLDFSGYINQKMNSGIKRFVFVTGGPFGFSQDVYNRANEKISLSKMTFSHQMVRLFFVEQLYRAMSILKGEKYHHE